MQSRYLEFLDCSGVRHLQCENEQWDITKIGKHSYIQGTTGGALSFDPKL